MKKICSYLISALAVSALLFSCVKEQSFSPGQESAQDGFRRVEFTACGESVRSEVADGHTVWSEGDRIKLFWDGGTGTAELTGGAGTPNGVFIAEIPEGKTVLYAVYPASAESAVSGTDVSATIPAEQAGTFSAGNIAVSDVAEGNVLHFYNVNAFVTVQLTGSDITRIVLESVDGSAVAGKQAVSYASEHALGVASETASSVTMSAGAAGTYYISVLPGITHAAGLLLKYYKGEALSGTYYLNKSLTTVRSRTLKFGEFEPDGNYYVTVEGAGNHNGLDWANAFSKDEMMARFQMAGKNAETGEALDAAGDGARLAAIDGATFHLSAGTYDLGDDPRIQIKEENPVTITLKGGYNASNGTRDLTANATVITGARDDTATPATGHPCLKIRGNLNITLDGLQFTGGMVSGDQKGALDCYGNKDGGEVINLTMTDCIVSNNKNVAESNANAAGLYIKNTQSLTATRVTFADNVALHAPAIYCVSTDMTMTDCVFENNRATSWGGAVRVRVGNPICVYNACTFSNNSAGGDSGCYVLNNGSSTFNNCTFTGNTCTGNGGAITINDASTVVINGGTFSANEARLGGVVYTPSNSKVVNLTISNNCLISGNHATGWGGALHIKTAGNLTVSDCTFTGNYSDGDSGAMNTDNANLTCTFNRVTFTGNHADGDNGGVVWLAKGNYAFSDCEFLNNYTAKGFGGAFFIEKNPVLAIASSVFKGNYALKDGNAEGGAIRMHSDSPSVTLTDCTFGGTDPGDANYSDMDGGALSLNVGSVEIVNCSFVGNHGLYDEATRTSPDKGYGGAIDCYGSANMSISGGSFSGNIAWRGGAINTSGTGTTTMSGVTFKDNGGSDKTRHGGGARIARNASLENCTVEGNGALSGGAFYIEGGRASMDHCVFAGNKADDVGGALYINNSAVEVFLNGCSFSGNVIGGKYGSAIRTDKVSAFCMNNCSFKDDNFSTNTSEPKASAWLNFANNGAAIAHFIMSNNSLTGTLKAGEDAEHLSDVSDSGCLIRIEKTGETDHFFLNNIIAPGNGQYGIFARTGNSQTKPRLYLTNTLYSSYEKGEGSLEEEGTAGISPSDLGGLSWADNTWKWNGPAGGWSLLAGESFGDKIDGYYADFKTWLTEIGAMGKDQLGNSRGTGNWWPGAYQN